MGFGAWIENCGYDFLCSEVLMFLEEKTYRLFQLTSECNYNTVQ